MDPRDVPVRFSRLKLMAQSAAHYRDACLDETSSSAAQRLGSGAHALVLGTPCVVYEGVRRGAAWQEFQAAHGAELILNEREHEEASAIAASVRSSALAMSVLEQPGAAVEQRIEWTWLGMRCAGTPDVRAPSLIVDLKTTRTAEPQRFARMAIAAGYHAQLAWYALGAEQLGLPRVDDLYVVAVENKRPYCVTVMRLTDEAREAGERLCRAWMERLAVAIDANHWGGYCESVVPLDVERDDFSLVIDNEEIQL